jgi:Leucine-rich repeat (LRR) protein
MPKKTHRKNSVSSAVLCFRLAGKMGEFTIGEPTQLKTFNLNDNRISTLPANGLGLIVGLNILYVKNNQIPLDQINDLKLALPNTTIYY